MSEGKCGRISSGLGAGDDAGRGDGTELTEDRGDGENGDNGFTTEARSERRRTEAVTLETACTPAEGRRRG